MSACSDVLRVDWRLFNDLLEKHMHVCYCRVRYCAYTTDKPVQDVSSWIDTMERYKIILVMRTIGEVQ